MFLTPRWIASHLFAGTLIVAFVIAGFWQVDRLGVRQDENAVIEARLGAPAVGLAELVGLTADDAEYVPVRLTGTYDASSRILVANRSLDGGPGFWDWTVLEHADGEILVNRGFVRRGRVQALGTAPPVPTGEVTVIGVARAGLDSGNLSESGDEVSRPNVELAASALGLETSLDPQVYVQLLEQEPVLEQGAPDPVPVPELSDGPHRSYAFQWFTFATIGLIGYALVLLRIRRGDPSRGDVAHAV